MKKKKKNKLFIVPKKNNLVSGDPGVSGYSGITRSLAHGTFTTWLEHTVLAGRVQGERFSPKNLSTEVT